MTKRVPLTSYTTENDIKYRGPLSYRYMRILGWAAMLFAQLAIIVGICLKVWSPENHSNLGAIEVTGGIFSFLGSLALPLLLIANFAVILSSHNDVKRLLIFHGGVAIVIISVFIFFYARYIRGFAGIIGGEFGRFVIDSIIQVYFVRYVSLNVFIDLFLCSLTYFFLIYKPTKHFKGKRIYIFRSMVIIPFIYELTFILIKGFIVSEGLATLPIYLLPFLTTKPPLLFFAFTAIVVFMKLREYFYLKKHTEKEYHDFLKTNANSLQISIFISIVFTAVAIIDVIVAAVVYAVKFDDFVDYYGGNMIVATEQYNYVVSGWGIGKTFPVILTPPLIMLFSYTKKHDKKTKMIDTLIPLAAFALIAFSYIEGIYEIFSLR